MIFGKEDINKNLFHKYKHLTGIDKVDIHGIVLSDKDLHGKIGVFKYLLRYITNGIKPLCLKLPQMNGYFKYFDSNNKYMNPLAFDKELLKNYNAICDKISNLLKKSLIVGQRIMIKYMKTKIN